VLIYRPQRTWQVPARSNMPESPPAIRGKGEPKGEAKGASGRGAGPLARPGLAAMLPNMSWHVYLLTCADGTLYCGVTSDLARRLAEHNGGASGAGAKYTRARRPVALAAHAPCADKSAALRLELAVKKRPRAAKLVFLLGQPDAVAGAEQAAVPSAAGTPTGGAA